MQLTITCEGCGKTFKQAAGKIRAGITLPCPTCPTPITIDAQSKNDSVRKALSLARRFRLQANRVP